jgi:tetratricopeptide (TPR) repeat protein
VMYANARDFDRALEVFDEILRLEPDFSPALQFRSNVFAYKGMEEESMRDMARGLQSSTGYDKASALSFQYAWFGHTEQALKYLEEAKKTIPFPEALPYLYAGFYACSGDADGFFTWIQKAIDQRDVEPETLRYAPWLDRVRNDPRFAELLNALPT